MKFTAKLTKFLQSSRIYFAENIKPALPSSTSVYKKVGAALLVTVAGLYILQTSTELYRLRKAEENLTAQNAALNSSLDETAEKLDETDKLYEETQDKLNDTIEQLESSEADAAAKQEIIDSLSNAEEVIDGLIDTFGTQNQSRSGGELYECLDKIEVAKGLIASELANDPAAPSYIAALDAEKAKLEDRIKRYPDYEPVPGVLSQRFGQRGSYFHNGLDVAKKEHTPVAAAAYGKVVEVMRVDKGGLGLYIKIDHGYGYQTLYAHLSQINVSVGQTVEKGQIIGVTGQSGSATGIHLHIEVFYNGVRQDPLNYLYPNLS